MRDINRIIVHCSDSNQKVHDNVGVIETWHRQRGFRAIGYHFVITKDGTIHNGRELSMIGAHTHGENTDSIGICLTGRDRFSNSQFISLGILINRLENQLQKKLSLYPHRKFSQDKSCPNFETGLFAE